MHFSQSNTLDSLARLNKSCRACFIGLMTVFAGMQQLIFAEDVQSEKPLATCAVQELKAQADNYEMTQAVVLNGYQQPPDTTLDNYARSADGQWLIPQQVDRTDPNVRLLILGPEQPLLVDIAIFIDGEPFTAAREKLIDDLLDDATVETLVRDAVKVSLPEDVKETEQVAESNSNDEESQENKSQEEDQGEAKKDPDKPVVDVQQRATRSVAQRLVNYMASADVKADREEVRWLLAEWTGGPAILTLGPAMNWQRVGFAPLWNAIDVDADRILSAAEIAAAAERLAQADVDENSIVELEELFAMGSRNTTAPFGHPLAVVIDRETNWQQLHSHLQAAYSRRETGQQGSAASSASALLNRIASGQLNVSQTEIQSLVEETADIKLRVSLGKQDGEKQVALLAMNAGEHLQHENMVTALQGAQYLEFSAGDAKEQDAAEPVATQIAIGAVVDGYPLFRLADRNGDRRLSPRECRNMAAVLAALDRNGDGQIDSHEKPTAIRVSITRGPHAHEMLAEPTSAARDFASVGATANAVPKPAASVPAWFTDMDRNRDGDVSRSEFLGTSEQFKQLDGDGDGLIGDQEATE